MTSSPERPPSRWLAAPRSQGIALVLVTMLLFAGYDALSKYLARLYPISELLWVRYLTHATFMLALFGPRMGWQLLATRRPVVQTARALLLVVVTFLVLHGLKSLALADATAIVFLTPLLVTAMSGPLLGETVRLQQWLAVLAGFAGVLVIVRPGGSAFQVAALYPLAAAICYSLYQIMTRRIKNSEHPATSHFITGLVGLVAASLGWQADWVLPATLGAASLVVLLGLLTSVGHYLLIEAFQRMGPASAAPFTYTQLVWAVLLGSTVFGEVPTAATLLGMLVITASGIYVARHQAGA